ncbi:MFS transporter [Aliiglaciecola sp. M165]|uniref:MFS transporter n=1 Tax=Aliiglaciecola sp. M165 TaxID=2593649 RepID=UPI00117EB3C0|nr:MFS transporter [Aliiglaciecola sp. M165]TRY32598.1 SLC45 family MFS transporter [Aliiglaciecola sp. M165]
MFAFQKNLTNGFYALLSLPATAMGFALSVQIAALSWLLTTQYGLDLHDVGFVWAAGPIAGILGQVIVGVISDNVWLWNGRRRPFIIIGGVLAALSLLALPNIGVISSALGVNGILGVAVLIALTLDLSINVSFNPTRAIIADVTPKGHERTKGYTWMQTVSGSFGVLAYVIGTFWNNYALIYIGVGLVFIMSIIPPLFIKEPEVLGDDSAAEPIPKLGFINGMQMIEPLWGFLIYSLYAFAIKMAGIEITHYWVEIACLLITLGFIAKTLMAAEQIKADGTSEIGFKKVLAAHSFTWLGVQSMFIYMIGFLNQNLPELTDTQTGQVISASFLVLSVVSAILPALLLEPLARKIGRVKVHTYCIVSMAIAYLALSQLGGSKLTIYVMMAFLGIGWAATISLPFAIMSQKVNAAKMGLYMGLFNLSVVLPQLVSSLGIGKVIQQVEDKNLLFVICGISLAISAVSWLSVREDISTVNEVETVGGGAH